MLYGNYLLVTGGNLPVLEPQYDDDLSYAFMAELNTWVDEHVDPAIKRSPVVHVYEVSDSALQIDAGGQRFDYGHFTVLGREVGFQKWRANLLADHDDPQLHDALMQQLYKPRPLANATLVITADGRMLCVRRASKMHLHPGHLHCNGGKVMPVSQGQEIDLIGDALRRVHLETGIPVESLSTPIYVGMSRNDPFDEVILLFTVRTNLTAEQVTEVYGLAQDPDGGVEWQDYNADTIRRLLATDNLTPSFGALLYVIS